MMRVFSLFLPALIPSWRFFDGIAPSPRIEVAQIDDPAQEVERWVEFNPRPQRVTFGQMLMRLVWNPHWNEQLFLVSCSERLRDNPTQQHSVHLAHRALGMSFDLALRLTEIMLGLAFIQQSAEHLTRHSDWTLFLPRLLLSALLVLGIHSALVCLGFGVLTLLILHRYQGPYNGGSDRMSILILTCLTLAHYLPSQPLKELAIGYLAMQLILSYLISGWVKLVNPDWRPFALLSQTALIAMLSLAALFHLANGCLFGLNRFVWTWIAAYPSILWLQHRLGPELVW